MTGDQPDQYIDEIHQRDLDHPWIGQCTCGRMIRDEYRLVAIWRAEHNARTDDTHEVAVWAEESDQ